MSNVRVRVYNTITGFFRVVRNTFTIYDNNPLKETQTFHDVYFGYRTWYKTHEPEALQELLLSCLNVGRYEHGQAVCCIVSQRGQYVRKMFLFTTEYVFGVMDDRTEDNPVIEWSRPLHKLAKLSVNAESFQMSRHPDNHHLRTVQFPTRDIPDVYDPRVLSGKSDIRDMIISCVAQANNHRHKLLAKQGLA